MNIQNEAPANKAKNGLQTKNSDKTNKIPKLNQTVDAKLIYNREIQKVKEKSRINFEKGILNPGTLAWNFKGLEDSIETLHKHDILVQDNLNRPSSSKKIRENQEERVSYLELLNGSSGRRKKSTSLNSPYSERNTHKKSKYNDNLTPNTDIEERKPRLTTPSKLKFDQPKDKCSVSKFDIENWLLETPNEKNFTLTSKEKTKNRVEGLDHEDFNSRDTATNYFPKVAQHYDQYSFKQAEEHNQSDLVKFDPDSPFKFLN